MGSARRAPQLTQILRPLRQAFFLLLCFAHRFVVAVAIVVRPGVLKRIFSPPRLLDELAVLLFPSRASEERHFRMKDPIGIESRS
jgi:hypothetical protein